MLDLIKTKNILKELNKKKKTVEGISYIRIVLLLSKTTSFFFI